MLCQFGGGLGSFCLRIALPCLKWQICDDVVLSKEPPFHLAWRVQRKLPSGLANINHLVKRCYEKCYGVFHGCFAGGNKQTAIKQNCHTKSSQKRSTNGDCAATEMKLLFRGQLWQVCMRKHRALQQCVNFAPNVWDSHELCETWQVCKALI